MNTVNPTEVVLLCETSCTFQPFLEQHVTTPVTFLPVPNLNDKETIDRAMACAHVVIGGWPTQSREARHVRLVQHVGAGIESYQRDLLPPSAYLCNVYEHETAVSEHIWMLLLALRRKLLLLGALRRHLECAFWEGTNLWTVF